MLEPSARRQTRILLVEDDDDLRGSLVELLQSEGFEVQDAANGAEALAQLRRDTPPDLILLDLMMPVMDGWQFRAEQKRDPAFAATPVVVFSGDDSGDATTVGADGYLKKPFDAQTLLASIALTIRTTTQTAATRQGVAPAEPARPSSVDERMVGEVLPGGVRLLRRIGSGGMGLVFEAERGAGGPRVAVKILNRELTGRPEVVSRFVNEARAVASLDHSNIVGALEVGTTSSGLPYFVLELLEGRTLADEIARSGPLPIGRAVAITRQLAAGLAAAHAQQIIHRDMKPANVFLTTDGDGREVAKVLDFGVSKFQSPWSGSSTKTGDLLGTPNYMAPEQLSDARAVDGRTDVYGLSATLFEMLAGRPPFGGDNFPVLFLKIMTDPAPSLRAERPDLPDGLIRVLERGLAKSSASRWPGVVELAGALLPFQTIDRPVRHRPQTSDEGGRGAALLPAVDSLARTPAAPSAALRLLMGGAVIALLVAGGALWVRSSRATRALYDAEQGGAAPRAAAIQLEVAATATGARIRVRGADHELPFSGEVDASSAREPIEITAPGREGLRFWLVLDRPRRLRVALAPGQGVRDALDDELAAAQVAAPSDEAAGAPPPR